MEALHRLMQVCQCHQNWGLSVGAAVAAFLTIPANPEPTVTFSLVRDCHEMKFLKKELTTGVTQNSMALVGMYKKVLVAFHASQVLSSKAQRFLSGKNWHQHSWFGNPLKPLIGIPCPVSTLAMALPPSVFAFLADWRTVHLWVWGMKCCLLKWHVNQMGWGFLVTRKAKERWPWESYTNICGQRQKIYVYS